MMVKKVGFILLSRSMLRYKKLNYKSVCCTFTFFLFLTFRNSFWFVKIFCVSSKLVSGPGGRFRFPLWPQKYTNR